MKLNFDRLIDPKQVKMMETKVSKTANKVAHDIQHSNIAKQIAMPFVKAAARRRAEKIKQRVTRAGRIGSMIMAVVIPAVLTLLSRRRSGANGAQTLNPDSMPSSGYPQGM